MINEDRNVRRNFTLPRELYEQLQNLAESLTTNGPGKVAVSDLIVEGARMVAEKYQKELSNMKTEWKELVYHAVTDRLIEAGDIDGLTAGGPDFDGAPDGVIADHDSDVDYGVGYKDGRPCLFCDEDGGYGYFVSAGFVYEQKYSGFAWEVV